MAFMILFYIASSIQFLSEKPQFSPKKHTMRISKISLTVLAAVLLFSCSKVELVDKQLIPQLELTSGKAPLFANDLNAKYIPGEYIVVFKDDVDVDLEVGKAEKENMVKAKYIYRYAIKGFSATLPSQVLEKIKNNPNVKYIEQDQEINAIATQTTVPSWGIDRIDQTSLPLTASFTYSNDGSGVTAYIFDTGIRFDHKEFGGRAKFGFDAFKGGTGSDGNGHGTHVAGTVGGENVGVAKKVSLIAVRVLDNRGSGSTTGVVAGIDWAIRNHNGFPAVGNMSLGGGVSSAIDNAVVNAINDGIIMCVAAGNSNVDAITSSPARVSAAITVGATDKFDTKASYSNFGGVVDIFAPGSSIYSSWKNNSTSYNTISGTSMAAPHVTGVAALILQSNISFNCSNVEDLLKSRATFNSMVKSVPSGTTSALLFSNF